MNTRSITKSLIDTSPPKPLNNITHIVLYTQNKWGIIPVKKGVSNVESKKLLSNNSLRSKD